MRALNANLYNWFLWFFDQLNCIPLVRARNHVRPPLRLVFLVMSYINLAFLGIEDLAGTNYFST